MQIVNMLNRGPLKYMDVDHVQRFIHGEVAAQRMPDSLIVWESQDTYTAGRRTNDADIPDTSIPVIRMDRGGSVTYHGPGQLVVYPVVKVRPPKDVVTFVRNTELAIMDAMEEFGLQTYQVEGRSGVWILQPGQKDRKLCAIGIKFADDATMHGLALNVTTNLDLFMKVIPCGLQDAGVASLESLGITTTLADVASVLLPHLAAAYQPLLLRPMQELTTADSEEILATIRNNSAPEFINDVTGTMWEPKGSRPQA
ncbi:lipoyl(octanoyl) transferase LipB [Trueperella pecoris]|uniref:Octanoyltransferase n=1 Tax=Trueperella pecoris TaxID=2733571 RepID=A0A7M1QZG4_9ACTO|nr:lipoyl(octanoyl) transferase LipB [Trueperella pecoris]QOR47283.1 lipoyl(octanoyl) transferase LipB [Trueperella pecoris]